MIVRVTARGQTGNGYPALVNTDFIEFATVVTAAVEYRKIFFESGEQLDVLESMDELEQKFSAKE